ncbi:MAG: DUF4922 domain-containing protein [Marinilabiliales bacterium]|nr:DUF4922 domain-containing protein [Marinilabiliales bacterium]
MRGLGTLITCTFQAGNRGFLPVESDIRNPNLCCNMQASSRGNGAMARGKDYGRGMMTLKGI